MAEQDSAQERTEEPTQKRLDESRDKGEVLRSRELNTLISMVGASVAMITLGATLASDVMQLMRSLLSVDHARAHDKVLAFKQLSDAVHDAIVLQVPFFVAMTVVAFAGPAMLGGIHIGAESLGFKFNKLDPIQGVARMFSPNSLIEVVKSLLKVGWLGLVGVMVGQTMSNDVLSVGRLPVASAIEQCMSSLMYALLALSLALIPIAGIDVPHQWWQHMKKLRMTRQEIKDEMKETDGNPQMKGRVRQQQRELSQRRMMDEVPHADVVITNPTHFAVALRYDPGGAGAPSVVAKGEGHIAARIRSIARENDVALFEAPPLARALFWSTELNDSIPAGLYVSVARVLAYVYQLRAATHAYRSPPRPSDLPIPKEFLQKDRQ
ncbi:MAG: flagellar biosynthetic protein FlhB [Gammaproteobacteria bacterium]